jgi:cytoskeletal protein RodZ
MDDIGTMLREARERRKLSLAELSTSTKIPISRLRAIEANEVDKLPGGFYTRAFIRAYAQELGLDPVEIMNRYAAQFAPPSELPEDQTPADHPAEPSSVHGARPVHRLRPLALGAAGLAIAVALYAASTYRRASPPPAPPTDAVNSVDRDAAPPPVPEAAEVESAKGVATAGAGTDVSAPRAPEAGALMVDLKFDMPCWVAATADGARVVYRLMNAGERQSIHAQREVVLRVGDPSALSFSVNGLPARSIGSPNQPATIRITPQNIHNFTTR